MAERHRGGDAGLAGEYPAAVFGDEPAQVQDLDLQARLAREHVARHRGDLGEIGGSENVTLLTSEMPFHTHTLMGFNQLGDQFGPDANGTFVLTRSAGGAVYNTTVNPLVQFAPQALSPAGGSLPHNNMQPYSVLNFCIALTGVFPSRN